MRWRRNWSERPPAGRSVGRHGLPGEAGRRLRPPVEKKMKDEASYTCDSCGEEIVVPIDLSAGSSQEYVEDCPVCCCPNVIHVEIDEDGDVRVWAQRE